MHDIHPITPTNKMSGQNCRLKATISDFHVAEIGYQPSISTSPFLPPELDTANNVIRIGLQKFQNATTQMGLRLKGLSLQHTT